MESLRKKNGFICDMDGVIYHGDKLLPGAKEFVEWLKRENKKYLFLDEVTSALDETNIRNVIDAVCNDPELTVLTVSHNHQWRQKSDLIYLVQDKKVALEEKMESCIE